MPTFLGLSDVLAMQPLNHKERRLSAPKLAARPRQICRVAAKIALWHGGMKLLPLSVLAVYRPCSFRGQLQSGKPRGMAVDATE